MSLVGASIGGYRLDAFIGAGGMGEVYRAVHTTLGRVVAIKLLLRTAMDSKSAHRFQNEARIQAGLRHPDIATLYEFLEFQGRPCIVMEYVEGETLAERLRIRGSMRPAEAMAVFRKVVDAVAYIHSQGVVHRDLKANNIKITPSGEVRILDFGIAKSPTTTRVTQIGAVVGTVENLAPEQIEGRPADFRTDVWALGILLYEMVSGRPPFEGNTVESLYDRILKTDCPAPSAHADVILRCLRKDPAERFQTASELLRGLDSPAASRPAAREPRPAPKPVKQPGPVSASAEARRSRLRYLIAAVAVLLLAVIVWVAARNGAGGAGRGEVQAITVDVVGGSADVWRDGRMIGRTPVEVQARQGERLEFVLKRESYQDLPVQFDVTERKVYSYTMEPAR